MATVMIEDARTEEKRLLNVTEPRRTWTARSPPAALIWNGAIPGSGSPGGSRSTGRTSTPSSRR